MLLHKEIQKRVAEMGLEMIGKAAQFNKVLHGIATRLINASSAELCQEIERGLRLTREFWELDRAIFF